jgi:hypothetical protein
MGMTQIDFRRGSRKDGAGAIWFYLDRFMIPSGA